MPVQPNEPRGKNRSPRPKPKPTVSGAFQLDSPFGPVNHLETPQQRKLRVQKANPVKTINAADPQVLSRQRLLRASGYHVAVDGIWGPVSQSAWAAYTRQTPTIQHAAQTRTAGANAVYARQRQQAQKLAEQARATAARAAAAARENAQLLAAQHSLAKLHSLEPNSPQITQRLAAAQKRIAVTAPHLPVLQHQVQVKAGLAREITSSVKAAIAARAKPAEQMTTAELVATTVDPVTGTLDLNKPDEVQRVQVWLQHHGHPQLAADGTWNKQTNAALTDAYRLYQRQEKQRQVKDVSDTFYATGIAEVGKLIAPGVVVPKANELLHILQAGDFRANILLRYLHERYLTSQSAFRAFQDARLDDIEKNLIWKDSLDRLDARTIEQRVQRLQMDSAFAAATGQMTAAQARSFQSQLTALGGARNQADLRRRLLDVKVQLDVQHQQEMHKLMGDKHHVHGFWGHTAHTFGLLAEPAHWLVSGVELGAADASYVYHHPGSALELTRSKKENAAVNKAVADFQMKHPWAEMGLEMAFDPLWLVDPLAVGGKVARLGAESTALTAYRLERVGLALQDGGQVSQLVAPLFSKPSDLIRGFQISASTFGHGETIYGRVLQLDHFYNAQRKLLRVKADAVAQVQQRIRVMRRNNFRTLGTDLWGGNPTAGEIRFNLDVSSKQVQGGLSQLVPGALRILHQNGHSLFSDAERKTDSVVGGQLRAFLTRQVQIGVVQNVALEDARSVFAEHVFGKETSDSLRAAGQDPFDLALQYADTNPGALTAAQKVFKETMDGIDFRGFGGFDLELARRIKPRLDAARNDIADVLGQIQDHLEARSEHAGIQLFDAEGKWVGRGSNVTGHLLSAADVGFNNELDIPNRAYNRGFTFDEMSSLRQMELEAARDSAFGTVARKAGEDIGSYSADDIVKAKYDDLEANWSKGTDGLYYDSRKTVKVPQHYSTHLRLALYHTASSHNWLPETLQHVLSLTDGAAAASPFVGELGDLADAISRARFLGGPTNRPLVGGAMNDYILRNLSNSLDVTDAKSRFIDTLINHTDLLDQAQKIVLPRELARDYALWAALAKAQSAPLRFAYKSLSAFLDVWLIATLPLRPGFVVRNVIDNTAKMLAAGATDPRAYFPRASAGVSSVFHLGVPEMRDALVVAARTEKNPAVYYFDKLIDSFWNHDTSVLKSFFESHNIPVPKGALEDMRFEADSADHLDPNVVQSIRKVRNTLMRLMANIPENAAKRVLYRDTFYKEIQHGATEMEAHKAALAKIDFVLFDYSKMTVLEDNLRFIFPFVQFWRKTTAFWTITAARNPALPAEIQRFEDTLQNKQNADLPKWMRRYVNLEPVAHTLARIPGLDWLAPQLLDGLQTDPMNLFSFNVLYRTFKNQNPDLPADHAGMKFIAPFVDALNDWGLSMNPLVRKPAEFAGVFNYRAWQSVFPETAVVDAISRQFFTDSPQGFNLEAILADKVVGLIGHDLGARERIEQGFNQWVQLEMAAQAERGDPVSRDLAEKKIQHYYVVQTILGFFAGMYARRRDDADVYLYNLQQHLIQDPAAFDKLSRKDQQAYSLFKRRKLDPSSFDAYVEAQPTLEAYYNLNGTYEQRQAFKAAHPEIIPYVSGWKSANVAGKNFVQTMGFLADTDTAMAFTHFLRDVNADYTVKQAAYQMFVTPRLRDFWAANDTPGQIQDRMIQGALYEHIHSLQQHYFSIPGTDYEARSGFLNDNPILAHFWNSNNSHSDDLKTVLDQTNATLRETYFSFGKNWQAKRDFLHRFPFIFQFTKADAKIDDNGDWIGGGKPRTRHARDYLAVKPYLDRFFALMDAGDKKAAYAYLNKTPQVRAYFAKWGKGGSTSQHSKDYLAIKGTLQWWFKLLKHDKNRAYAWLDSKDPDAKKVQAYFDKYASKKGMTAHAAAYLKIKPTLKAYFDLQEHDKKAARAYLDKHPELSDYFKTYSAFAQAARKWKDLPGTSDPALNKRIDFWRTYWTLEPDARPSFVADNADDAGVFVYGILDDRQQAEETAQYLRDAMTHKGMTKKVALYLRVKPLLDLYYTLTSADDKDLFLRANPDLQNYLDNFTKAPTTGDKQLDGLIERYFSFDRRSAERWQLIEAQPKLKAYFDAHSSAADLAMREALDTYFKLDPRRRNEFSAAHPEIQAYFDQRKLERQNALGAAISFDAADPRLAPYIDKAWAQTGQQGLLMMQLLRESVARNRFGDTQTRRGDTRDTKNAPTFL